MIMQLKFFAPELAGSIQLIGIALIIIAGVMVINMLVDIAGKVAALRMVKPLMKYVHKNITQSIEDFETETDLMEDRVILKVIHDGTFSSFRTPFDRDPCEANILTMAKPNNSDYVNFVKSYPFKGVTKIAVSKDRGATFTTIHTIANPNMN